MNGKASDKSKTDADTDHNASDKSKTGAGGDNSAQDAIALLKADHRAVEKLFKQYEEAGTSEQKTRIARQVCTELIVHAHLEEEIFYASCREHNVDAKVLDEAQVEHDSAKLLIGEILQQAPESPYYDAKVAVLSEYVKHHVGEEENPSEGIFAKARAAKLDMNALGQRLQARKQELMQQGENLGSTPPELCSLELRFIQSNQQEISAMTRQHEQGRDEYGRFSREDDDYRRGGRGYAQSNEHSRDESGRFISDDDSRSGRHASSRGSYRDDDDYRSSSGRGRDDQGRYASDYDDDYRGHYRTSQSNDRERDERGRFISEDGGSGGYSGRYRDDDDYGYRSSRGASGRERDEQGRFMRDEDDRNSRGSSRGQGGWFGDPEGHARAAEEGWRHRESSSSRYERDDNRGRSRSDNDERGWYGDPQGHAEAARRGWQHRR